MDWRQLLMCDYSLIVTLRDNKTARSRITYVQPKAERAQPHTTNMEIVCHDWIDPEWCPANFAIAGRTFHGRCFPVSYKLGDDGYIYRGIFEMEQANTVPEGTGSP